MKQAHADAGLEPKRTPDKSGEFPFHCDVFCGSGHESMTGTVIVT